MWICDDCSKEFIWPKWAQREINIKGFPNFVEEPYCPFCNSFRVDLIEKRRVQSSASKARNEPEEVKK